MDGINRELLDRMDPEKKRHLLKLLQEKARREKENELKKYFPRTGPLSRDKYPKHMEFFAAGKYHRERMFLAGNRVGKTVAGGYELALHLTGRYPEWWPGRMFNRPIRAWAAGDTKETTRDIIQAKLLGSMNAIGSGMIPAECIAIKSAQRKPGIPNAIDTIAIRHISGGRSTLGFKAYDQKRKSFQGTEQDIIWLDEECPMDVYAECLTRTMTTNGLIILTFTPLSGLTPLVTSWLDAGKVPEQEPVDWKAEIYAAKLRNSRKAKALRE